MFSNVRNVRCTLFIKSFRTLAAPKFLSIISINLLINVNGIWIKE